VFLVLGIALICAGFLAFVSLVWRSDGAIWLKVAGTVGLLAMVALGSIRLVIASRPYGYPR